jgi:hypothetical protein
VLFSGCRTGRLEWLEAKSEVMMDEGQSELALLEPTYFCDLLVTPTLFCDYHPPVVFEQTNRFQTGTGPVSIIILYRLLVVISAPGSTTGSLVVIPALLAQWICPLKCKGV